MDVLDAIAEGVGRDSYAFASPLGLDVADL